MSSELAGSSTSVEDPIEPADYDLVVFFEVNAPQESIDAVEQLLLDDPEVEDFWFVSPEMAQEEYETMFSEQAGVLLPASFRILLRSLEAADRLDQELRLAAGVKSVGTSADPSEGPVTLVVVMTAEATDSEIDAMWDHLLTAAGVDDITLLSNAGQDYFSRFVPPEFFEGDQGSVFLVELQPDSRFDDFVNTISGMDGVFDIRDATGASPGIGQSSSCTELANAWEQAGGLSAEDSVQLDTIERVNELASAGNLSEQDIVTCGTLGIDTQRALACSHPSLSLPDEACS